MMPRPLRLRKSRQVDCGLMIGSAQENRTLRRFPFLNRSQPCAASTASWKPTVHASRSRLSSRPEDRVGHSHGSQRVATPRRERHSVLHRVSSILFFVQCSCSGRSGCRSGSRSCLGQRSGGLLQRQPPIVAEPVPLPEPQQGSALPGDPKQQRHRPSKGQARPRA